MNILARFNFCGVLTALCSETRPNAKPETVTLYAVFFVDARGAFPAGGLYAAIFPVKTGKDFRCHP